MGVAPSKAEKEKALESRTVPGDNVDGQHQQDSLSQ